MSWLHAHRGASADAPENTLAAFRLGLDQGADGIELDVHLSADGVPVVIHDGFLDRTTDRRGEVAAMTASEVALADTRAAWVGGSAERATLAAAWPAADTHVPLLRDVLAWLPRDRALVLDVKVVAAIEATLDLLGSRRTGGGTTRLISFLPAAIERAHALAPWLATGLLLDEQEDLRAGVDWAREHGHRSMVPWDPDLDAGAQLRRAVALVHGAGLQLGAYTVNEAARARELRGAGIDFLMSDVPGRIVASRRPRATLN